LDSVATAASPATHINARQRIRAILRRMSTDVFKLLVIETLL
jgi:hypothetical protein